MDFRDGLPPYFPDPGNHQLNFPTAPDPHKGTELYIYCKNFAKVVYTLVNNTTTTYKTIISLIQKFLGFERQIYKSFFLEKVPWI